MKNQVVITIFFFIFYINSTFSQTGVGNRDTKLSMEVGSISNIENPCEECGVIIPRVKNLNNTSVKEVGLLVFLEAEDEKGGFYWWTGSDWVPFVSISQTIPSLKLSYFSFSTVFKEGTIFTSPTDIVRNIRFKDIETNEEEGVYSITKEGDLLINKSGLFYLQSTFYFSQLTKTTKRDSIECEILINGESANLVNDNYKLSGVTSFPVREATNTINISGPIRLSSGQKLSAKVTRYFIDDFEDYYGTEVEIGFNEETQSNLTLRYMGDK